MMYEHYYRSRCYQYLFYLNTVLAYAMTLDKWVIPVLVEPMSIGFSLARLLDGIWISDLTSAENFEREFPLMLRTIKALI